MAVSNRRPLRCERSALPLRQSPVRTETLAYQVKPRQSDLAERLGAAKLSAFADLWRSIAVEALSAASQQAAKALAIAPTGLFVNGSWREPSTGRWFDVLNPATGRVLASVADAGTADGTAALDAASATQEAWAAQPPRARAELLRNLFDVVQARAEEFATLMTLEMGKPLSEARSEVAYGAEFLRWFSEEAVRLNGRYTTTPEGNLRVITMPRAVGPVLAITPWNFPLAMVTRKLGPALAAGCTGILKPARATPLTALAFADACREAGIPDGVINVLPTADSRGITGPIIRDPRLRKLSFTGSTDVGKVLLRDAAANVLRTSMELGGCAPFVVFADADLDRAVTAAKTAKLRNMGEACNAANRFYVQRDVADEFAARLAAEFESLVVGDGLNPGTDIGPIISEEARADIASLVERAAAGGAQVLTGGEIIAGDGYFYPPTVLSGVSSGEPVVCEEIFGPVAPVVAFDSEDEVLAWANASPVGLAGYVHTGSLERALRMADHLEVGMVGINSAATSNPAAPFGGIKHSGLGREGGPEGITEYLETIYVAIPL